MKDEYEILVLFCSASDSTILHNVGKDFVQKKSQ